VNANSDITPSGTPRDARRAASVRTAPRAGVDRVVFFGGIIYAHVP
jgi:hypothetical protein